MDGTGGCRIVYGGVGSLQCRSAGSDENTSLQKQRKRGVGEGLARAWPVAAPMPKSNSF